MSLPHPPFCFPPSAPLGCGAEQGVAPAVPGYSSCPFRGSPVVTAGAGCPGFILTLAPGPGNQRLTSAFAQQGRAVPPPPPAAVLGEHWGLGGGCGQPGSLPPCLLACPKQPPGIGEVRGRLWHLPARSFAPFSLPLWVAAASLGCPGADSFCAKRPGQGEQTTVNGAGPDGSSARLGPARWHCSRSRTGPPLAAGKGWACASTGLGTAPAAHTAPSRARTRSCGRDTSAPGRAHWAAGRALRGGLQERCVPPSVCRVTPQRAVWHTPCAPIPSVRILPRCRAGGGGRAVLLLLSPRVRPRRGSCPAPGSQGGGRPMLAVPWGLSPCLAGPLTPCPVPETPCPGTAGSGLS